MLLGAVNFIIIIIIILYDVFKTICGTYKPYTRLAVLHTDPEIAIKSLTRGIFVHYWSIFTKISTCGSPICSLDHCVSVHVWYII